MLLASNVAYVPSIGGAQYVLSSILERLKDKFDRIVVFVPKIPQPYIHNGIEVFPYSPWALRKFAIKYRPSIYMPTMVHSPLTYENIGLVSRFCGKTIVNMIGGYPATTPLSYRKNVLDKVAKYADYAIHADPLSTEYLIDRSINPTICFTFISQGIDHEELNKVKQNKNNKPYFLFAHNLHTCKAPEVFIKEIVAKLPQYNFKILADNLNGDKIVATKNLAKKFSRLCDLKASFHRRRRKFFNPLPWVCNPNFISAQFTTLS